MAYPKGVADILPLTSAQRGMLFHAEYEKHIRGQYIAVIQCTLQGPLDCERLRAAMNEVVQAHDALRAGFVWKGVKQPVQVVQEQVTVPWTELDWTGEPDIDARLSAVLQLEQSRQFDLNKAPLMAVAVIKTSADQWRFIWTVHHLISDGWSTGVALHQIFTRYTNETPITSAAPSFKSYLLWLRKRAPLTDVGYWTRYLADLNEPCLLPELGIQGEPSPQRSHNEELGSDVMNRIRDVSAKLKVTPNALLSAAWALVLRKYLQKNDIVVGTTTVGRPPDIPNISNAIGAYINTLPVRFRMDPSQPVGAFLQEHARSEGERLTQEYASLAEVQKCAPFSNTAPVFDTLFVNEGTSRTGYNFGAIQINDLKTTQFSNYPLAILVTPQEHLGIEVYFDPMRISAQTVRSCIADYRQVLSSITDNLDTQIRDLFNRQQPSICITPPPDAENVVKRFLQIAETYPCKTAISDGQHTLSYADLSLRARQIAYTLRTAGVRERDIVPVALPRGAEAIAGFLGVMMCGASYVPFDLDYPQARLSQMLNAIRPRFVLTTNGQELPETDAQRICPDGHSDAIDPTEVKIGKHAYVMFTSGSENKPKGVVISQTALAISTTARDAVYGAAPQAYLLLSSLAFDSSVAGIYWTLCTGGHLVIAPKRAEQQPLKLGELFASHGVTHTLCLPGLAQALLETVPKRDLQSLKVLIAAGESLSPHVAHQLRSVCPGTRLVNEYGPTEATVWCTSFDATALTDAQDVPIGAAIPGTCVGIVDFDDCPLEPGNIGEIIVAGDTVADGYLNDPSQTNNRFFKMGPDRIPAYRTGDLGVADAAGCITFLGRKDKQVKIRGHRVELPEIEATAQDVAGDLRVAAIVMQRNETKRVALAVECDPENPVCETIHRHIKASLPEPFHPSLIIGVDTFPMLPNGKLDQNTLENMILYQDHHATGDAPNTELEQKLAALFSEVLKSPCQTRNANFFDLGGDSLSTITAYSLAREQGIAFEPTDLFACPTVAELAKRITDRQTDLDFSADDFAVQISNPGTGKTTVVIADCSVQFSTYMARSLGGDHSVVHIPSHLAAGMAVPFGKSFADQAENVIFKMKKAGNTGPFVLCGYSAGCPLVMEIARQLGQDKILGLLLLDPPFKMTGAEPALQPLYYRTYKRWRYAIHGLKKRIRARRTLPAIRKTLAVRPEAEDIRIKGVEIVQELAISRFRVPRLEKTAHVFLTQGNPSLSAGDTLDTHLRNKRLHTLDMEHFELMQRPDAFATIASVILNCASVNTDRNRP